MNGFLQDLRFGLRSLGRNYRSTIVSVLSLALGIGAVTSIYCTVTAVLLNPVPFPEAGRIVHFFDTVEGRDETFSATSYMDFTEYQKTLSEQFEFMGAFSGWDSSFRGPDGPERLPSAGVSSGFFPMLRVPMLLGRAISPEADDLNAPREAVISEALWRRAYRAAEDVVGKNIVLDGESYTICGVAPETFRFIMTGPCDAWLSLGVYKGHAEQRGNRWLITWGRLRDGVSWEQAEQAYRNVVLRLAKEYPDSNAGRVGLFLPPGAMMLRDFRPALLLLTGAVVLVLAIACVNVANLLLANAAGRRKEIAIRAALGATRGRIVRQLLTESVLLAVLGGTLGILVALWGNSMINLLLPPDNREFYIKYFNFGVRPEVLVFTLGVSVVTGLLFGLAPALEGARTTLADTLKEGGRGGGGGLRRHRLLSTLVVSEVALALVLLVGAGLLIQSMRNIYGADPGFDTKNLLTFQASLPGPMRAEEPRRKLEHYDRMIARLGQLGGVERIGMTSLCPFSGDNSTTWVSIEGQPEPTPDKQPLAGYNIVSPGFFATLGVPIVRGRDLTDEDRLPDSYWEAVAAKKDMPVLKVSDLPLVERSAVINETMAKAYWPGEDAVGKRFAQGKRDDDRQWYRVVGIARDFHSDTLNTPVEPELYMPFSQTGITDPYFVVRGPGIEARMPDIRKVIAEIDADQAISYAKTMEYRMGEQAWFWAFIAGILSAFALIALVLSAVGVYGVINCSVAQRTHEIGVRMALGATPGHVQKMVVMNGMKLALAGGLIGLAFAFGLTRLLQDMLYGVGAADPVTFIGVALILMVTAAAASWIPARKATKVNPVVALRYE